MPAMYTDSEGISTLKELYQGRDWGSSELYVCNRASNVLSTNSMSISLISKLRAGLQCPMCSKDDCVLEYDERTKKSTRTFECTQCDHLWAIESKGHFIIGDALRELTRTVNEFNLK